ncbi:oxidoreductase [Croceicoccus estronivorus]|uniref:oxidoreductase n=1 Tax=Croceicoccus estronivorus TaxID=1172626 RepID=UPI000AA67B49|nr:oxidoreductase [Croceicoccus estronivorus]
MAFTEADVPSQEGKCFVVTGANAGLGFSASAVLAARGARVVLACRNRDKAKAAMVRIREVTPDADLTFLKLDQGDLASVRAAAEQVSAEPRIDALVNNAGVMYPPLVHTAQGFEPQFGVNHLGCFALTSLLLPKLSETPGSRVVVTASLAHRFGKIDWDDLDARKSYKTSQRYADSKLANLLFLYELDRRLRASGSPVMAVGCHPGVAATELGRNSAGFRFFIRFFGWMLNTAEMGAWPTLQAATDPAVVAGGYYGPQGMGEMRGPSGLAKRVKAATDPETARRLWDVSIEKTGIDPGLPPA